MLDESAWNSIRRQISHAPFQSGWVAVVAGQPLRTLGEHWEVSCESKILDQSYIDFLDEQIELDALGAESTAVLRDRRQALKPWVGCKTAFLSISHGPKTLWIRFNPENCRIILLEAHSQDSIVVYSPNP